jgi:hypothetical protein
VGGVGVMTLRRLQATQQRINFHPTDYSDSGAQQFRPLKDPRDSTAPLKGPDASALSTV